MPSVFLLSTLATQRCLLQQLIHHWVETQGPCVQSSFITLIPNTTDINRAVLRMFFPYFHKGMDYTFILSFERSQRIIRIGFYTYLFFQKLTIFHLNIFH